MPNNPSEQPERAAASLAQPTGGPKPGTAKVATLGTAPLPLKPAASSQPEGQPVPEPAIVVLEEVKALIRYVSRMGEIDPEAKLVKPLARAVLDAEAADDTDRDAKLIVVLELYTKLTAITYPLYRVNGRTVVETKLVTDTSSKEARKVFGKNYWWRRYRVSCLVIVLFLAAMVLETINVYFADPGNKLGSDDSFLLWAAFHLHAGISKYLIPVCWGGIGSCVFILKRLSDSFGYQSFDYSRMHGDLARILLGAALGVATVAIFFPKFPGDTVETGGVALGPATVAFLVGLGVKVVYGAFEQLVEFLSTKITGRKPASGTASGG